MTLAQRPLTVKLRMGHNISFDPTTTVLILGNNVEVVACLDMTQSTSGVKYIYYHATTELALPSGATQPVRLVTPGTAITTSNTCTVTSYATGTNDVLINTSEFDAAVITCPDPLLANFDNYTVTKYSSATSCDGVGYIHVCDDSQTVIVEYGLCAEVLFYSSGGNLSCVYYTTSGTTYYVNLLNSDSSVDNTNTYNYACMVIDYTASPVYATQWPRKCDSAQTATSIPSSSGYKFEMYTNLTCVPGGGSAAGGSDFPFYVIIIALIAIGAVAAGLYFFCFKKKKLPCSKKSNKGKKGKVDPMNDTSVNSQAPMDGKNSGLQATAVLTPMTMDRSGATSVNTLDRRNLETSQSTRSAITVSHMHTDWVDDTPRRLPPLEDAGQTGDANVSDTPSMPPHKLPPINESLTDREMLASLLGMVIQNKGFHLRTPKIMSKPTRRLNLDRRF